MRIILGHDYYDNVLAYGHDAHVTFVREREHYIKMNDSPLSQDIIYFYVQPNKKERRYISANQFYVGDTQFYIWAISVIFCGKRYNGIRVSAHGLEKEWFFWDYARFNEFLTEHGHYMNTQKDTSSSWERWYGSARFRNEAYFGVKDLSPAEVDWLIANRVTILTNDANTRVFDLNSENTWRVNGDNLKDLHFFKIVDAYTAFQEIEMWIGGVLPAQGNPMVVITDDKVKAEKHGFDRWSFRKMKEGG